VSDAIPDHNYGEAAIVGDCGGDGVATDVSSRSRPDHSVDTTRLISYRCCGWTASVVDALWHRMTVTLTSVGIESALLAEAVLAFISRASIAYDWPVDRSRQLGGSISASRNTPSITRWFRYRNTIMGLYAGRFKNGCLR